MRVCISVTEVGSPGLSSTTLLVLRERTLFLMVLWTLVMHTMWPAEGLRGQMASRAGVGSSQLV